MHLLLRVGEQCVSLLGRDGEEHTGAAWAVPGCQGISKAMDVFADMALPACELAPTPAVASDGLESGMHGDSLRRSPM